MGFDLFSPIALDIQIWASFDPVLEWRQNEGLGKGDNIKISKTSLKNELLTSKKPQLLNLIFL